jgi:hypothetical protein
MQKYIKSDIFLTPCELQCSFHSIHVPLIVFNNKHCSHLSKEMEIILAAYLRIKYDGREFCVDMSRYEKSILDKGDEEGGGGLEFSDTAGCAGWGSFTPC